MFVLRKILGMPAQKPQGTREALGFCSSEEQELILCFNVLKLILEKRNSCLSVLSHDCA